MTGTATDRFERHEQISGLLKGRDHITVEELSAELGVSSRTISRDLAILRDRGVPIESDRGRGGGLRIQRNWALGRLHLAPAEAIDLLLSIALAERLNSPLFLQHLPAVMRKIVASFGETHQPKIRQLRSRILMGSNASDRVLGSFEPVKRGSLAAVAEAFFTSMCLGIQYADARNTLSYRTVEPQFLYFTPPVWYLLTWDRTRAEIRYFRADRIKRAELLEQSFRPRDRAAFLAQAEAEISAL